MVTLDGTLINKAGLMTGGSSAGEAARASRWNQKEHEGLKQAEAMARRELERIGDVHTMSEAVASARHAYETTMQELENAKADRQVTAAKEVKHRKQLETLNKTRGQTEKRLADAEAKQASQLASVRKLQEECNKQEDKIFAAFSKSLGLKSVREYEDKVPADGRPITI